MKLLIVDDEKLTREGILKTLPLEKLGIHQTFLADDGIHGLKIALKEKPDLILTDVRMPRMSGLELQDKMQELGIDLPIIFISGHGDIDMAVRTLKQGAVDFLQKPVDDQRLLTAIGNAVMKNLNHRRTEIELSDFRKSLEQLTQREREVIRMVAQGMSNKQVAESLGISEKTVQVHRGSAYRKLDLHNAAEIARLLLRSGDPL